MASAAKPARRIYTVPPGKPFLMVLAEALLAGDLPAPGGVRPDPMQLTDVTLLLPLKDRLEAMLPAGRGDLDYAALVTLLEDEAGRVLADGA